MKRLEIKVGFKSLVLGAVLLTHAYLPAQAVNADGSGSNRTTIAVECGAQCVIDADWTITFNICDSEGKNLNSEPIVVTVPTGTGSGAAAQRMAVAINMAAGSNIACGAETKHPKHQGASGHAKTEDVVVADGYKIKQIVTKRKGKKASGHLNVESWVYKPKKDKRGESAALKPAAATDRDLLILPPAGGGITDGWVWLDDSNAAVAAFTVYLSGTGPDGLPFVVQTQQDVDGLMPLEALAGLIGDWFNSSGLTASYPTPTSIFIDFAGSGFDVEIWSFSYYLVEGLAEDIESSVGYTAH